MASTSCCARTAEPDGLDYPARVYALATIFISITLALVDSAVANVALPLIAADLKTEAAVSLWVVNGYQFAFAICLIPFADLGEIHGYRVVYRRGLIVFTVASVACAVVPSMLALTLARIVQGVGAAGILSVNTALLRHIVPGRSLGRAIGWNSLVAATAATIGPSLAGAILSITSWPMLFAINLSLGLLAIALASKNLPANELSSRSFDFVSAALSAMLIGSLSGSIELFGHGMHWQLTLTGGVLRAIAAGLLARRELRASHPLVPFDLLRIPVFSLSVVTSICTFAAQMMGLVSLPFLFHETYAFAPGKVGLLMTPWPLTVALTSPVAGHLTDRIAPGPLGAAGLLIFALGLVSLAALPHAPRELNIVWRMALCGLGFALFQSPNNRTLLESAPRSRSGAASGMLGTARLIGQSTGTAIVALFLVRKGVNGVATALLTAAAFAVFASVVSAFRIRTPPSRTAGRHLRAAPCRGSNTGSR
ncbi:MFS transporter [Paraburkholderia piptadeniae]|uniref:MFS transporter n=1 Tax=Paraburkholderia piptadeniae TaxID=1701573 RepID=UPI000B406C9E|nr:MFS transporter [Paraburkholderia piptadeniae]